MYKYLHICFVYVSLFCVSTPSLTSLSLCSSLYSPGCSLEAFRSDAPIHHHFTITEVQRKGRGLGHITESAGWWR